MTHSNLLSQTLVDREARVSKAIDYIKKTQHLFDQFASSELKAAHARFEPLIQGLQSDKVRIVVIGEFSRGKSRLVNAILGIDLLPSAKEATTAINTFLQSPPPDRAHEKYITLNFIDPDRSPVELSWDNDQVLKQWGTELDKDNKNARSELQSIDVFAAHDLLNKGLVVIDTPGLESVVAHHEAITRKAIAGAHIAIWVQSVEQLGGNSREWAFLKDTVRQHFRKFLTVVNMWDQVLEPEDDHDKAKPEAERVEEKLNIVRDHFRSNLSDLSEAELAQVTDSGQLMGVSAKWALSKDQPELRRRSGIDQLIQRIADLCNSGEAQQEIFYKPLQQLSSIQRTLATALDDEIHVIDDQRDIKYQQKELELLDQEIKNQSLEQHQTTIEHREEHERIKKILTKEINENLVQPMMALREELDILLTENYIKREIDLGHSNIGLPAEAQAKFKLVTNTVSNAWLLKTKEIEKALNDLKTEYVEAMKKHSVQLEKSLAGIKIELPEITIDLPLDLSGVIDYQNKKWELTCSLEQAEQEIHEYELKKAELSADDPRLRSAQAAFERAQRQLDELGGQPSPINNPVNKRGWFMTKLLGADWEPKYDYTLVEAYQAQRSDILVDLSNREQVKEQLMREEAEKHKEIQTTEVLRRKAERKLAKLEKQHKEHDQALEKEKQALIAETLRHLKNNTIGELNKRISYLENNASQMIATLFDDQLSALLACVEEQFMQPLRAKQAKREEVLALFEQGQADIERRKTELLTAKKELDAVMGFTQHALAN